MKNAFYYSNSRSLMFEGHWEVNIELYLLSFMSLKAQPLLLRCFPLDSLKSQTEKNVSLTQWNILMIKASVDPVFRDWHLLAAPVSMNQNQGINDCQSWPQVSITAHIVLPWPRHHETPGELWSPPTMISNNGHGECLPPATTLPVFSPSVDQYS